LCCHCEVQSNKAISINTTPAFNKGKFSAKLFEIATSFVPHHLYDIIEIMNFKSALLSGFYIEKILFLTYICKNKSSMDNLTFAVIVFLLAFPFGFLRAKSKFKSRNWMLAIHIPVVFIILLRIYNKLHFHTGFTWVSVIYNVTAFMLAQYLAGLIYKNFKKNESN